jgi:hypothetical protein
MQQIAKKGYFLGKLQHCFTSKQTWCDLWFIKSMNIRLRVFLSLLKPADNMVTLKGPKNYFKAGKISGVIVDRRTTWRLKLETREAKVFRRFIGDCSIFKVRDEELILN